MKKSLVLLVSLIVGLSVESPLPASERSLTNDVFLAEIRGLAKDGKLAEAEKLVLASLQPAEAAQLQLEQVVGNLYLINLRLLNGFDTNAAVANVIKMRTAAAALPRGPDQIVAAVLLDDAAILMIYSGIYAEAESCFQWAYDIFARRAGPYDPRTSYIQGRLGSVQLALGRIEPAAGNLRDAVTNLQLTHVKLAPGVGYGVYRMSAKGALMTQWFMSDYANILRRQEKFRYEGNRLKQYMKFLDRCFGKDSVEQIPILVRLGYNYESRKSSSSARKYFESAITLAEKHRFVNARVYWETLTHAYDYYRRSGNSAEQARIKTKLAEDPSPVADQTAEAESLRQELHASFIARLQELFDKKRGDLRRQFILERFVEQ